MTIKYRCDNCGGESLFFALRIDTLTNKQMFPRPEGWGKVEAIDKDRNVIADLCVECTKSIQTLESVEPHKSLAKKPPLAIVKVNGAPE